MRKRSKYQFGGDEGSTSFFNQMADAYLQQMSAPEVEYEEEEEVEEEDLYADYDPEFEALQAENEELRYENETLSSQRNMPVASYDDGFLDWVFQERDRKGPFAFEDDAPRPSGGQFSYKQGVTPDKLDRSIPTFISGISDAVGGGVVVTSGYRSPDENRAVGGVKNSYHTKGLAADIRPTPALRRYLKSAAGKAYLKQNGMSYVDEGDHIHFERDQFQYGGEPKYVFSPEEQHRGLNDPSYDEMIFPMTGTNTFRGLDNGQPVLLVDEAGNQEVLYNNQQTASMQGTVYEQRMQFGGSNVYENWYSRNTREGLAGVPSSDPMHSYDYKSYYSDMMKGKADYVDPFSDDHYTDYYKYPNHPSFSTESKYFTNVQEQPNALSYTGEFKKVRRAEDMPLGRFY